MTIRTPEEVEASKARRRAYMREYVKRPDQRAKYAARAKANHEKNRDLINTRHREYAKKNRAKYTASAAKWRANNPEKAFEIRRHQHLKRYGLTLDGYDRLLASQGGVCAICKKTNTNEHAMPVDHDHATNTVRGILCDRCNRAIGLLGDSASNLHAAAFYLGSH